ncbi:MAG: UDP-N-acetylmuramoyl-tripeptide--D-alanyl-D-alanine ligase [Methylococcales bacterium]
MRLAELADLTQGQHSGSEVEFSSVGIDTRTLHHGDLYIAIRGEHYDGNNFVDDAQQNGAVAALVERNIDLDFPHVIVPDSRLAMGQLAKAWRLRSQAKVIGVTGSNGKTTVKEMIASIAGVCGSVLYTYKNLNNDLGVPLTLLRLQDEHQYAVVEMGANHPGEIAYSCQFAKPDIGVITNAAAAHLDGFGSLEGVANAKGEMISALASDGTAVLNADDPFFGFWRELAADRSLVTFGLGTKADVVSGDYSTRLDKNGFTTTFDIQWQGQNVPIQLHLAGRHNVSNALAATAAAFAAGIPTEYVREGLARVNPVPGRLEPVPGWGCVSRGGVMLINDSYNANPGSFSAAVDVLCDLSGERWLVLGAFGELGEGSFELHAQCGREALEKGVNRLFVTGEGGKPAATAFGRYGEFHESLEDLINALKLDLREGTVILVKGSRCEGMERVVERLTGGGGA